MEVEAREMRDEQRLLSPVLVRVSTPKWLLQPRFSDLRKSGWEIQSGDRFACTWLQVNDELSEGMKEIEHHAERSQVK